MGTWVRVPYWPLMRPTTSCTMLRGGTQVDGQPAHECTRHLTAQSWML